MENQQAEQTGAGRDLFKTVAAPASTVPTGEAALYRSIVEDSAIGVYIAGRKERRIRYTNGAFREICGFDHGRLTDKMLREVLHAYGKQAILTEEQVATLQYDSYSEFHVTRRGLYLAVKAKALIWNGEDSYILYIADESREHARQLQLVHANEEMRRNRIREQTLMDSIPGGSAIYRLKKDGRTVVEYASDGYCDLLGYPRAEIMANPDICSCVVHEDLPLAKQAVQQAIEAHGTICIFYHILKKDGQEVFNKLDAKVMPAEELGTDDIAVLYAVHSRVSDASRQAMQEQSYYRMILNMTGTAYCEWDRDKGFYASEKYDAYALSTGGYEALMGRNGSAECIHPDDMPVVLFYMNQIIGNVEGRSITVRMKMKSGGYQWTEVVAFAEKDQAGSFTKLVGVFRDVDKEWIQRNKQLQTALDAAQKANQAKTAFLSRVSHDMRTPLNGILGLTSFLKDTVTDEQSTKDISQLEISGKYLLNLINDTLDVSRIENGKLELHPTVCDGRKVLDNVLRLAKPNIAAKQLHLTVNTEGVPFAMLYMDVGRVEQIMMNILGNAVKFTPEGGNITCTMENLSDADGVITNRISIRDTGVGMSKEFLPHIFDAFSQADTSQTNDRQGTGLGMAITRQLVERMGGTIVVESELGKGSCFTLTLPLPKATPEQLREWQREQELEPQTEELKNKCVLLCEDHPLNAQIAHRLLQKKGVSVECAVNGSAGVSMFAESAPNHYDAILMDIRMPLMDGLTATRKIRKMQREDAHTVPIIAMTGNSFDEDVQQALDAGMNAHLSKPVDTNKLFAVLIEQINTKSYYRRKKVLVVDDIELNRAVVRAAIEDDYDLEEAENGVAALEMLEKMPDLDAVITDIMMPKMDGAELIRRIRANTAYDRLAIIANTQYGEVTQEDELAALGADEFIYKPNTPQNVAIQLRKALRKVAAK